MARGLRYERVGNTLRTQLWGAVRVQVILSVETPSIMQQKARYSTGTIAGRFRDLARNWV
jgi:hypothetical protein